VSRLKVRPLCNRPPFPSIAEGADHLIRTTHQKEAPPRFCVGPIFTAQFLPFSSNYTKLSGALLISLACTELLPKRIDVGEACNSSIFIDYELGNNINSKVLAFAFSLSAEIERSIISSRTKEALARKKVKESD
jgi:hypothetical protein